MKIEAVLGESSQTGVIKEITTLITLLGDGARLKVGRGVCEGPCSCGFFRAESIRTSGLHPNPAVRQNVQINGEADPVVIDDQAKRATN